MYIFAINGRDLPTKGVFTVPGLKPTATVTVLGEDRTLTAKDGVFTDEFAAYEVHLYRIRPNRTTAELSSSGTIARIRR